MRSIILVSTGVMDLKSERQPGVAVLGTGHIEACFHWRGTVAVARPIDKLKRRASGLQKIGAPRRRNQAGNWSGPVAVVGSLSRIMTEVVYYYHNAYTL